MKEIIDKLDFIKIKNFCSAKDIIKKIKKTRRKCLQNTYLIKGFYPKYTKNFKLNNKKTTQLENEPKTLTDTSPKKIYRWQISIWKNAPHHMSSGKCKLKHQWDTTTRLLEWPKSTTLTSPNAGADVEQQELSLLIGMQNGTPTLEDGLATSYKTKHILPYDPEILLPWYLLKS